ncbi:MAG: hypothetical protein L6R43_06660 [Planctomycetes bacterium]|nr:hypothetical protein [Planctomycetota bacterium]
MRAVLLLLALLPSALLPPGPARAAGAPSPAEEKARREAAALVLEFASWCSANGAKAAGTAALEEARDLDRLHGDIPGLERALAALPGEGPGGAAAAKRREEAGKGIARVYDRLAAMKHEAADDARFREYGARALRWEPSEARVKRALAAVEEAGTARPEEAGILLRAVKAADPEGAAKGRFDALEARLAQKDVLLLGSPTHPLMAFVSLPREWRKGREHPVLVAVDGAGCGFLGCARGFAAARGSRPLIVVSPMTLSNTNDLDPAKYPAYDPALLREWAGRRIEFDGKGMDALLAEVRRKFGGEERVFVTGFSGGGNWCYYKVLTDPAGVRGAAPACANFAGYGVQESPGAGEGGGPPVHILTGEKDEHRDFTFGRRDSPGIEPQTDAAVAALEGKGFTNLRRTMVKGAGHSPLREQVLAFVDEVLAGKPGR